MTTSRLDREGVDAGAGRCRRFATATTGASSPFRACSIVAPMRRARRSSSSSSLNSRLDQERVERMAVARRGDLRAGDIGAGRGAGAGEERQQARMVRRKDGELGDRGEGVGRDVGRELLALLFAASRNSAACATCVRGLRPEPVVG